MKTAIAVAVAALTLSMVPLSQAQYLTYSQEVEVLRSQNPQATQQYFNALNDLQRQLTQLHNSNPNYLSDGYWQQREYLNQLQSLPQSWGASTCYAYSCNEPEVYAPSYNEPEVYAPSVRLPDGSLYSDDDY